MIFKTPWVRSDCERILNEFILNFIHFAEIIDKFMVLENVLIFEATTIP